MLAGMSFKESRDNMLTAGFAAMVRIWFPNACLLKTEDPEGRITQTNSGKRGDINET
jgi:hypothetical protein